MEIQSRMRWERDKEERSLWLCSTLYKNIWIIMESLEHVLLEEILSWLMKRVR